MKEGNVPKAFWYDGPDRLAHAFPVSHELTLCNRWRYTSLFTPMARYERCPECREAVLR